MQLHTVMHSKFFCCIIGTVFETIFVTFIINIFNLFSFTLRLLNRLTEILKVLSNGTGGISKLVSIDPL
jgi:hypothetical protein